MSALSRRGIVWLLGALFCFFWNAESVSSSRFQIPISTYQDHNFDWHQITPSSKLEYTSCHGDFECARLDVPLNWNATGQDRNSYRAAVAVIRLPAKVPVTHESYGGVILVNPGGPGESGIDQVLSRGKAIQTIVDSSSSPQDGLTSPHAGKYFDIVGFDPRGVKYTTPPLSCFPDAFSQQVWLLTRPQYSHMYDSNSSFALEWARTQALGWSCSAEGDDSNMIRYANTAQTVEDMIEIIERHGESREEEASRIVSHQRQHLSAYDQDRILARTTFQPGKEMLQYWGFSYGSLLGQTFAAIHPDRVGKMVIDGIVEPHDYYHGSWLASLQDSDKVMSRLCEYCFEAGPSKCPLFTGSSAKDIEHLVEELVMGLRSNPVIVGGIGSWPSETILVTFDDFYLRAINAMAFPFSGAEDFFRLLAELRRGNVSEIAASNQAQLDIAASLARCHTSSDGCMPERYFGLLGPTPAIECMDSADFRNGPITKAEFDDYLKELTEQSKWFSPSWARHRMSCIGMTVKPAWSYEGNIASNTSHPLVIIGNTLDTVTPLRNARKVSTLFPGSVVLQQDSEGHCSHANPSSCTAQHVRYYFQTGKLPEPGTICQPDWRPFIGKLPKQSQSGPQPQDFVDDDILEKASAKLARNRQLYEV